MSGYVLTKAAQADLDQIWEYTERTWSTNQAEFYVGMIRDACRALGSKEKTGQPADRFRPGYFRMSVGSHFIFYTLARDGIVQVMRVLHRRMNLPERLRES